MRPVTHGPFALLLVFCVSCSAGATSSEDVIDRETFIATYVELRRAALTSPGQTLGDESRAQVLRQNAVSEADLIAFANAWGGDNSYMTRLWEEVGAGLANPDAVPVE